MSDPQFAAAPAAEQVDEALNRLKAAGLEFWGMGGVYTRRRTVKDTLLQHYHPSLSRTVAYSSCSVAGGKASETPPAKRAKPIGW